MFDVRDDRECTRGGNGKPIIYRDGPNCNYCKETRHQSRSTVSQRIVCPVGAKRRVVLSLPRKLTAIISLGIPSPYSGTSAGWKSISVPSIFLGRRNE